MRKDGQRLVGIVSLHDFFLGREPAALERVPRMTEARRVSEIMTERVRSASTLPFASSASSTTMRTPRNAASANRMARR